MKGSHGFISVTEWPLMIVSGSSDEFLSIFEMETILKTCTGICRKMLLIFPTHMCFRIYFQMPRTLSWLIFCSLFIVLYGDVRRVHPVRPTLVYLVSVLLEGSAEDPVLDSRGDFPGDGGDGCLLCWIRKHQCCWLCLWVSDSEHLSGQNHFYFFF